MVVNEVRATYTNCETSTGSRSRLRSASGIGVTGAPPAARSTRSAWASVATGSTSMFLPTRCFNRCRSFEHAAIVARTPGR